MAAKKSTKKSTTKKATEPMMKDHLGSRESFQFALHVATLAVLIVAFVTMVGQMGRGQEVRSRASEPVSVVEEVTPDTTEEDVLGMETYADDYNEDDYDEEYYYGEDEYLDEEYYEDEYSEDPYYADSDDEDSYYEDEYTDPYLEENGLDY